MEYVEPPADPNQWTDEQWLEWLKATDDDPADAGDETVSKVMRRLVDSTPGQVLGQAMIGLSQALYGRHDDVVVVVEGSGEAADDEPFTVRLDPEHPERSSVVFRAPPSSTA